MSATAHSRSYAWQTLSKKRIALARQLDEPCGMCGQDIDYTLSGRHKWGATTDHPEAVGLGGNLIVPIETLRVVHHTCNSKDGRKVSAARRFQKPKPAPLSGRWRLAAAPVSATCR